MDDRKQSELEKQAELAEEFLRTSHPSERRQYLVSLMKFVRGQALAEASGGTHDRR